MQTLPQKTRVGKNMKSEEKSEVPIQTTPSHALNALKNQTKIRSKKRISILIVSEFIQLTYECMNENCQGKSNGKSSEFKSNISIVPQKCPFCESKMIKLHSIEFQNDKIHKIKK